MVYGPSAALGTLAMIGSDQLVNALGKLVKRSPADATSVCAEAGTRRVMRFAYEAVHQDLVQESLTVYIKVISNKRMGVASTNLLDRASLQRGLDAALEIARHAPPIAQVPQLPKGYELRTTEDYLPATINVPPKQLVDALKRLFQLTKGAGAQLAGSMALCEDERAVANSRGLACYSASTVAGAKLVAMYKGLSGFASGVHREFERLDLETLLARALKQTLHRKQAVTLPHGTYDVILEPEAVAELVMWLGFIAFGAKSFQERTSCLAGRMGEQLTSSRITISDDANDPAGLRMPFDFEGVPAQKVLLIDRGKAAGIVYDTTYGAMYGQPSTGHALPPDDIEGPLPTHLLLEAGDTPKETIIRSCKRAILIPRFHYVSGLLNPRETLMTGLTREGACLIEHGKRTAPVATMRFTQNFLEALEHVIGISKERELIADPAQDAGSAVMPTMHLAKFRFTGSSDG